MELDREAVGLEFVVMRQRALTSRLVSVAPRRTTGDQRGEERCGEADELRRAVAMEPVQHPVGLESQFSR